MKLKDIVPWKSSGSKVPVTKRPSSSLSALQREFNRLFEDFFSDFPFSSWTPLSERSTDFMPRINVEETDERVVVTAELPGMDEKDIEISLSDDRLTISGEKKLEHKEEREGRSYYEASYGSFQRTIPLEDMSIDQDKIDASMKKGVLTVVLPKLESSRRSVRKVNIRTD